MKCDNDCGYEQENGYQFRRNKWSKNEMVVDYICAGCFVNTLDSEEAGMDDALAVAANGH